TRMPAPSPDSASAPEAPRCSRFSRAVSARVIVSRRRPPSSRATSATPQASCSYAGSYRPALGCRRTLKNGYLRVGRPLRLSLLVGCGGEESRLAQTNARDEREGNRLRGVRCAQHSWNDHDCRAPCRQSCSPVSSSASLGPRKKPAGDRTPTGFVARPHRFVPASAYPAVCSMERTTATSRSDLTQPERACKVG